MTVPDAGVTSGDEVSTAPPATEVATVTSGSVINKLEWYYARLFPIDVFVRWLRYGRDDTLSRREISFTLPGEIYIRWKSYGSGAALHDALKRSRPVKIDIGAIYNFDPANKNVVAGTLTPLAKELVFDIDMTDYADVLGKQGGGNAVTECDRAWVLMAKAVDIIDTALRDDFGFRHILWVYSGRRGVHCWVADKRARCMTNEQRSAVADFLHVRFGGRENAGKRQTDVTVPMHPSLLRARRKCTSTFHEFSLGRAGVMDDDVSVSEMTAFIPSKAAAAEVTERIRRLPMSTEPGAKWERLEREVARLGRTDWTIRGASDYIVLRHVYPRLDVNVSREINHLLKAPFSVHPKTGRVCVPFRPENAFRFNPEHDAPQIDALLAEINTGAPANASKKMKQAVEVFEEFVRDVEREALDGLKAAKLEHIDTKAVKELLAH